MLRPGGFILVKYFAGGDEVALKQLFKKYFRHVRTLKPGASRSESREGFMFGGGFKGSQPFSSSSADLEEQDLDPDELDGNDDKKSSLKSKRPIDDKLLADLGLE